jgi:hypothetical protein
MTHALQVLLSRMAAKLGSSLQPQHAATAAGVLTAAAAGVSAQVPQLDQGIRRDIAAAVLASGRHRKLIKSALHAIVAGSSRSVCCMLRHAQHKFAQLCHCLMLPYIMVDAMPLTMQLIHSAYMSLPLPQCCTSSHTPTMFLCRHI